MPRAAESDVEGPVPKASYSLSDILEATDSFVFTVCREFLSSSGKNLMR